MDRRLFLLVPLSGVLIACDSMRQKDQAARLDTSLNGYAGAIRWGNLDTAYGFVRPRDTTPQPPPRLEGLKVTGYEIRVSSVNETRDEAQVSFSFTYYFQDQGRVQTTVQNATWYFDPEVKAWLMDAPGLPAFQR